MIPGINLLNLAMGPIAKQTLQHRAWVSRAVNAAGAFVSVFAEPVPIQGSFQPINKALYQQLGLNLEKNYSHLWTRADVRGVSRDREGDLLTFDGRTWQCENDRDWRAVDGWRKLTCVEVPS